MSQYRSSTPDELFDEITRLKNRQELVIDEFKCAQHKLFVLAAQDHAPKLLDDAHNTAVAYYEAYLDNQRAINVLEKRYTDLTS